MKWWFPLAHWLQPVSVLAKNVQSLNLFSAFLKFTCFSLAILPFMMSQRELGWYSTRLHYSRLDTISASKHGFDRSFNSSVSLVMFACANFFNWIKTLIRNSESTVYMDTKRNDLIVTFASHGVVLISTNSHRRRRRRCSSGYAVNRRCAVCTFSETFTLYAPHILFSSPLASCLLIKSFLFLFSLVQFCFSSCHVFCWTAEKCSRNASCRRSTHAQWRPVETESEWVFTWTPFRTQWSAETTSVFHNEILFWAGWIGSECSDRRLHEAFLISLGLYSNYLSPYKHSYCQWLLLKG